MIVRFDRDVRLRCLIVTVFFGLIVATNGFALRSASLQAVSAPNDTEPDRPHVFDRIPLVASSDAKPISLTFNVSWGEHVPAQLLQILRRHDVRVTFFVTPVWAARHAGLARAMLEEGHEIGMLASIDAWRDAQRTIHAAVGVMPSLIRPPGALLDDTVLETAAAQELTVVLWDVDAYDWLQPDARVIVQRVVDAAEAGSIVLLHADDHQAATLQAIRPLLEALRRELFKVQPLGELLPKARPID